jgi:hypothetical protein
MRESELFEGNRLVRGIKKIHDGLLAIVRLYDQLRPTHVTLAVAWRQTLLLALISDGTPVVRGSAFVRPSCASPRGCGSLPGSI